MKRCYGFVQASSVKIAKSHAHDAARRNRIERDGGFRQINGLFQATEGRGNIVLRTRVLTNTLLFQRQYKLVACIEIQDDGPGVPEEIEDTLFYPLVTGRDSGTGLGLPLAQDLVNRHGGLIEYDSVPGHTVFTVQIPIEQSSDKPVQG